MMTKEQALAAPLTVLVVDDDPDVLQVTEWILREAGFHVLTGATAAEALELTHCHRPALVLLDVMLPDGNGVDVARQLKGDPALADVFVILFSGTRISSDDQAKGLVEGLADGYMVRPLSKPELLARIDAFLRIRETQRALRESEQRYRLLAEHTTDVVWLTDMDMRPTYQSPSSERLRGFTTHELRDLPLEKNLTPESLKAVLEVFHAEMPRIMADPGYDPVIVLELEYYRKDGSTFWSESKFSVIRDDDGKPVSILGEGRDISERRQAREARRESDERHRAVLMTTLDGFWLTDAAGRLLEVNEAYCRMSGYSETELLGMRVSDLEAGETAADVAARLQRIVAQGEDRFESRHRRKDGSLFDVEISVRYQATGGGRLAGFLRDVTEQREVEAQARASAAMYRRIVETAREGIWAMDAEYRTTFVNSQMAAMLGYEVDEMLGREVTDFIFEEDLAVRGDSMREHTRLQVGSSQTRLRRKDGVEVWALVSSAADLSPEGEFLGSFGMFTDITERKQAEEALRESEEKYRTVADFTYDWEAWTAPDGTYRWVSPSCTRITGHAVAEFMADPDLMVEITHPDDRSKVVDHYDAAAGAAAEEALHVDFRILTADGEMRWISHWCTSVYGEGRQRLGRRESNRDITERMQAEEALCESENKYRSLVENVNDVVFTVDLEGRFTYMSPVVEAVLGYAPEEMVGLPFSRFIFADDLPLLRERFQRMLAGDVAPADHRLATKSGGVRWVRGASRPVMVDGQAVAIQGLISDITELKRAEQGLLESLAVQQAITEGVIEALVRSVETRDPYTSGHQRRVSELAAAMAVQLELGEERAEGLRVGGMLHDIGKINIPAEILSKPSRLAALEFELIKRHAQSGFEILDTVRFPWPVAQMALQHHERQDGSGYPAGLAGDEILLEARILAVADVVEAMASHRPYRAALGLEAALEEVRSGAGTRFDAEVVAACERAFAEGFVFSEA